MRLDRAVSIYLSRPILRMGLMNGPSIPILMYHNIRDGIRTRHPYYARNTSPKTFACQMQFLRESGYEAVDIGTAFSIIRSGTISRLCVVLTFDDGYHDFYTNAFPVLAQNGFTATVFLVSGLTRDVRVRHRGQEYLTWSEVRELQAQGIQIGSHTVNHPELRFLPINKVDYEIGYSKHAIEDKTGSTVRSFSFPYAFPEPDRRFTAIFKTLLQKHEYENGVSTIIGTAGWRDNQFCLPRLPVNSWDDPPLFQAKLQGNYDWLHRFQYLFKVVKAVGKREGRDLPIVIQ